MCLTRVSTFERLSELTKFYGYWDHMCTLSHLWNIKTKKYKVKYNIIKSYKAIKYKIKI